jgi:hypothetical protein
MIWILDAMRTPGTKTASMVSNENEMSIEDWLITAGTSSWAQLAVF